MMICEYSEDKLIEQITADLFFNQCGCDTQLACNKENLREGSNGGRLHKKK